MISITSQLTLVTHSLSLSSQTGNTGWPPCPPDIHMCSEDLNFSSHTPGEGTEAVCPTSELISFLTNVKHIEWFLRMAVLYNYIKRDIEIFSICFPI